VGKSKAKRKKRRRRGRPSAQKKGGVLLGMRSGFKNVANKVTGQEPANKSKKSSILGTVVTILLVAAAAALLWKRFR
jgi:hypothetical protein